MAFRGSFGWAAQVVRCFAEHGKSSPWMADDPVEEQLDRLLQGLLGQQQAILEAVPLGVYPGLDQSCSGLGVKLCTYRRWFSRPARPPDQIYPDYWQVP